MFRRFATVFMASAIAFSTVSCSDDDDEISNQITLDSEKFAGTFTGAASSSTKLEGPDGSTFYEHYVVFFGGTLVETDDAIDGKGPMVGLSLSSPTSALAEGTYKLTEYTDANQAEKPFEILHGYFYYNVTMSDGPEKSYLFDEATLNVSKSGGTYTFTLTGKVYPPIDEDDFMEGPDTSKAGKSVKVTYKGVPGELRL